MYEGITLRVKSNSRARMSSYDEIMRHTCLSRLSWVSYTWFVWSLWTTEAPPSEEAAGKQNNTGCTCMYKSMLCLLCSLKKTSTDVPLLQSWLHQKSLVHVSFVGIGSKLQMVEGNNNQKVFNFSKSKFQV